MSKSLTFEEQKSLSHFQKEAAKCLKEKDYRQALSFLLRIQQYKPSHKLLSRIGFCYHKLGMYLSTLEYYSRGLTERPNNIALQKGCHLLQEEIGAFTFSIIKESLEPSCTDFIFDPELLSMAQSLDEYRMEMSAPSLQRLLQIISHVPGYGKLKQFAFFNCMISKYRPQKVLLIGVYKGRDSSFILDASRNYSVDISFTGVDKFSDDFCADWPQEDQSKTWEDAGFGPAPSIEEARKNLRNVGFPNVHLIKSHDEEFLAQDDQKYDLIYIDTSHDYETVRRQLHQVRRLSHEHTIISGDDYSDHGTWGVKRAVIDGTKEHGLFLNWVWYTFAKHITV